MSVKRKRQSTSVSHKSVGRKKRQSSGKKVSDVLFNLVLPLGLIVLMLGVLGSLAYVGYMGAARSDFFKLGSVVVYGTDRIDKAEVEGVVKANVPNGLWVANLEQVRNVLLGKFPYAKSAAVSRQLPDTVTVTIVERVPKAIVRKDGGDSWVDDEGVVLGPVLQSDDRTGWLVMTGWDSSDADRSKRENKERVKAYIRLKEESSNFNVVSRVTEVDASNLSEIKAFIDQEGQVEINLGKEDFGKRLETAITAVSGSSSAIGYVDARVSPAVATARGPGQKASRTGGEQRSSAGQATDSAKSEEKNKVKSGKNDTSKKAKN